MMTCPNCTGQGKIKALNLKCTYCSGSKTIQLTKYLQTLGKTEECARVEHFQRRTKKTKSKVNG